MTEIVAPRVQTGVVPAAAVESADHDVTVVVLAGGASTRFGSDKLAAPLRGSTVLDHLLHTLPGAWRVIVVGPERPTVRPVTWAREEPAGGGPLAAAAAGLDGVATDLVAVVAGDMPHAARALVRLAGVLHSAAPTVAAAVGEDDAGLANPLLAVYRTTALREAVPRPAHGLAASRLLAVPHLTVRIAGLGARDIDTVADRAELDRPG